MKKINFYVTLLALLFTTSVFAQQGLPDVSVKTLKGETVKVKDFATNGKVTVLSFWATWCSPCKKELDAIAEVYEEWQEDYNMELIAITVDDARALPKVRPMVESKGWEYMVLSDVNEDLKRALNFQTVPMTFVLDKEGKIVYKHSGYSPGDEYDLEDKLKELSGK